MLYTREVPYVYARDSIYYFSRRLPKDLQRHYRCSRIVVSLDTKSGQAAKNIYLRSKGDSRPITFSQAVEGAVSNLVNAVGDKLKALPASKSKCLSIQD